MTRLAVVRSALATAVTLALGACAVAPRAPEPAGPASVPAPARAPAPPTTVRPVVPEPTPLPEAFESDDFVVAFAKAGDTPEMLAVRFLGDAAKAWMVEDYNGTATFTAGQKVVVPKRPWNLSGVEPGGQQLVPVLCYHSIGPQARGRLLMSAKAFEEQMRYLKTEGYRVVSLADFLEFTSLKRQLPRKTVVLTFDDGWKSFREHALPLLKELGFTATLFIYTDFVGSRLGLGWEDLREMAREGFDIQAHSKTHGDLRRKENESEDEYARRTQAELVQPLALFQRQLGLTPRVLAYPYGSHDADIERRVKDAGYVAAFDVRRQGNASFVPSLGVHRSQIYSDMSLEDFVKNLNVFNQETVK